MLVADMIFAAYEKLNHVRELHYGNGVSPFALWFAYLLFDMQFIVIEGYYISHLSHLSI